MYMYKPIQKSLKLHVFVISMLAIILCKTCFPKNFEEVKVYLIDALLYYILIAILKLVTK